MTLKHDIAKGLYYYDVDVNRVSGERRKWSELPYHMQLKYNCEAKRVMMVMRRIKNERTIDIKRATNK